jgi:hypothetical protein
VHMVAVVLYRRGAVTGETVDAPVGTFHVTKRKNTSVLSFRYMKLNFCCSFVHIVTINLSNVNMSCETVKKTIFKSTTPATMFVSVWEVRVIN